MSSLSLSLWVVHSVSSPSDERKQGGMKGTMHNKCTTKKQQRQKKKKKMQSSVPVSVGWVVHLSVAKGSVVNWKSKVDHSACSLSLSLSGCGGGCCDHGCLVLQGS